MPRPVKPEALPEWVWRCPWDAIAMANQHAEAVLVSPKFGFGTIEAALRHVVDTNPIIFNYLRDVGLIGALGPEYGPKPTREAMYLQHGVPYTPEMAEERRLKREREEAAAALRLAEEQAAEQARAEAEAERLAAEEAERNEPLTLALAASRALVGALERLAAQRGIA